MELCNRMDAVCVWHRRTFWVDDFVREKSTIERKKSLRDVKRENDGGIKFYAAMAGKEAPDSLLNNLPPKKERAAPVKGVVRDSEHKKQVGVIFWWRKWHQVFRLPEFALFAIPNGGSRNVIEASNLKAEGVRRGVPDLFLSAPANGFHGLYLEMKHGKNKLSDEQTIFLDFAKEQGYSCHVCYETEEAINKIKRYFQG